MTGPAAHTPGRGSEAALPGATATGRKGQVDHPGQAATPHYRQALKQQTADAEPPPASGWH